MMKQKIISVIFSIVCLLTLLNTNAQDKKKYSYYKEDNISKSYPASGNNLDIDNSFGKVEVITWNSNEIKVDVHISVGSNDKDVAERIFNTIKVTDEKNGNDIFFKTSIKSSNSNHRNCNNCSTNMNINYVIHLPSDTKLNIKNSFGGIILPDYNGNLSIESRFGSVAAKALSNVKKLSVEFGSANISSLENIDASIRFSSFELNNLSGDNQFKFEFCGSVKIGLTHSLTALSLNESYSTINLKPASDLAASYNIHTNFSSVVNRSAIDINRTDKPEKYGPDSRKIYEGQSGNGSVKINVKSSFGHIIIGEPKSGDIKEKKAKKDKDRDEEEI